MMPSNKMERELIMANHTTEVRDRQAKKCNKMVRKSMVTAEASTEHTNAVHSAVGGFAVAVTEHANAGRPAYMGYAHLEDDIAARLLNLAPTGSSIARGERCLQELKSMMQQLGPEWDVHAFGSFANGFGTVSSDLDVTCRQVGQALGEDTQQHAAVALGSVLCPMLEGHSAFTVDHQIFGARVPIVKLRFEKQLDVDLSYNNVRPLRNTRLLTAYSRMDTRVRDLGIAVKLWAKRAQICDASMSNLSSYSFTLLVLYFLQVCPNVRLPVLPVDAFEDDDAGEDDLRVIGLKAMWHCELSLSDLAARFWAFYTNLDSAGFRWGKEVVSVRTGSRNMVDAPIFAQLRGRHANRLHIEDPYEPERNLHCVLGNAEEDYLRAAFSDAMNEVALRRTPIGLKREQESHDLPFLRGQGITEDGDFANLVREYKLANTADNGADSTMSGGTAQGTSSDEDNCVEGSGEVDLMHSRRNGSANEVARGRTSRWWKPQDYPEELPRATVPSDETKQKSFSWNAKVSEFQKSRIAKSHQDKAPPVPDGALDMRALEQILCGRSL